MDNVMSPGKRDGDEQKLRSQVAALEQLLAVHEETVRQQSNKIELALEEVQKRAHSLERSEAALREQTRILQSILRSMGEGVVVTDEQGKLVLVNPAAERIVGLSPTDAAPTEWTQRVGFSVLDMATSRQKTDVPLLHLLRGNEINGADIAVRRAGGQERTWLSVNARPLKDEAGTRQGGVAVFRDVTREKQAEEALHESEERFRSVVQSTVDAIISIDSGGHVVLWNKGGEAMFGYSADEMVGRPVSVIVPERFREAHERGIKRASAAGGLTVAGTMFELVGLRKDGTEFPLEFTLAAWRATSGLFFTGIVRDITERKRVEEALRLAKFSVDRAADAVYWIDPKAKVLDVNETASLMLGYSKEELCTMTVHDLNPDFQADMWPGFWAETKRRGTMVVETAHRAKNGRLIPIEVSVNYLSYEGKEYHCVFVRDITERKRGQAALSASEARFRSLVSNLPGAVYRCACDPDWTMEFLSDPIEHLCGYPASDFLASRVRSYGSVIHPNDRQMVERVVLGAVAQRWPYAIEYRLLHKDGGIRWVYEKGQGVFAADGQVLWLDGAIFDIAERKRAEEERKESEERYRSIFENAVEGIFQTTLDGKYVAVNPALARMYGYDSPKDMIAAITNIASQLYVDPGRRDEFVRLMQEQETVNGFEALVYRKDGSWIWVSENVRALRDPDGVLVGYEGTVEHITERKRAEARLRATLDQVRTLTGRIETVQEDERARIARELHDELGVGLTCLKIDLSRLNSIMGDGAGAGTRTKVEEKISSMVEQVDTTIASVQRLVTELRPAVLDDLGLVAAIEWQCQDFQKRTGIPCACVTSADDIEMESQQATALFRICQEALTNMARHAQATAATVKLESWNNSLRLVVADNGVGIPDTKVSNRQSLGLLGMKERVTLFGGEIMIQGHPGQGTTVTVWLPRRQLTA